MLVADSTSPGRRPARLQKQVAPTQPVPCLQGLWRHRAGDLLKHKCGPNQLSQG